MIRITPTKVRLTIAPVGSRGPIFETGEIESFQANEIVTELRNALINHCSKESRLTDITMKRASRNFKAA